MFKAYDQFLQIFDKFSDIYNQNIDEVDVWPAGLLESMKPDIQPGPLFQTVTLDQFRRLRDGDRFYYENNLNR